MVTSTFSRYGKRRVNDWRYGVAFRLIVFTRTYDEALDMVVEARNYMTYMEPRENSSCHRRRDTKYTIEAMRITSRLLQVMAWLMLVRAVQRGEICQEEIQLDNNRLSGQEVCLGTALGDFNPPIGLRSLLDRSHDLYQRVLRLEEMVLARVATGSLITKAGAVVR